MGTDTLRFEMFGVRKSVTEKSKEGKDGFFISTTTVTIVVSLIALLVPGMVYYFDIRMENRLSEFQIKIVTGIADRQQSIMEKQVDPLKEKVDDLVLRVQKLEIMMERKSK